MIIEKEKATILNASGLQLNCIYAFEYNKKDSSGYIENDFAFSSKDAKFLFEQNIRNFWLIGNCNFNNLREFPSDFRWFYDWEFEWEGKIENFGKKRVVCLKKIVDGKLRRILIARGCIKKESIKININMNLIWDNIFR